MMKPVEAKHVLEAIPYRASKELDTIADVVLRYRPPEKAKATKKREKRRRQRVAKKR